MGSQVCQGIAASETAECHNRACRHLPADTIEFWSDNRSEYTVHTTLRAEISWFPFASIMTGRANANPCSWDVVTLAYQARKTRALMACSFQQQKEKSNFFIAFVNIVP